MSLQQTDSNQSNAYYSSTQFPSPMVAQYSYPPPEGQANSPSATNMSLPSLSLPPIRTIDGMPQQQQQQQGQTLPQKNTQAPMGSAMPPTIGQYYAQGQPYPQPSADPNQPLRYALPPDGRVMSGGRHKKEIKRRTKTGCLTCRKRRIKCDEEHPACRNCQKSKRECLGYDPIFKSQPGPTVIQPAVSGAPSQQSASASSSPYPIPPQGYMHAGSQGYGQPVTDSEKQKTEPFEYGTAIDPALEIPGQMQGDNHDVLGTGTPYPTGEHRAKRTKIEDLLCLQGVPPPPPAPPTTLTPSTRDEIKNIYLSVYATGIDKFLETKWFGQRGLIHLLGNNRLCDQFISLMQRFSLPPNDVNSYQNMLVTQSLEATVIWAMMGMCRQVARSDHVDELEVKDGVHDAAKRLEIYENLVTGEFLDSTSAPQKLDESEANGTPFDDQLKDRERRFWRLARTFLTIRDDEASAANEIDNTLASCRVSLDSRENRDVIYSIMITRHIGARMAESLENPPQPQNNDEDESKNKLVVAKRFIEAEAGGRGTNQVVQRLCGMVARSWSMKR